ncbi:MAG: PHP domain-containing protein [Kiritimatiellaeota bacterium]|nr:PHP domain-containing protein [Kiritimatiellota bacterium]
MIDLHFHSTFSDGTDTPETLAALGAEKKLAAMVLTDHDNAEGCARFAAAANPLGIATLTGIELSTKHEGVTIHILGYGIDPANAPLNIKLEWAREARNRRNAQILANLARLGYPLQYGDMMGFVSDDGKAPGRPHIARALAAKGYVKNVRKAFDKLLGRGKPAYAERERLTSLEALALIHGAGGVAVMAHPGDYRNNDGLSKTRLREIVAALTDAGLVGLEVWHPSNGQAGPDEYLRLASEFKLIPTGGSDYHGASTAPLSLGTGYGSLSVPDESFAALCAKINEKRGAAQH